MTEVKTVENLLICLPCEEEAAKQQLCLEQCRKVREKVAEKI